MSFVTTEFVFHLLIWFVYHQAVYSKLAYTAPRAPRSSFQGKQCALSFYASNFYHYLNSISRPIYFSLSLLVNHPLLEKFHAAMTSLHSYSAH